MDKPISDLTDVEKILEQNLLTLQRPINTYNLQLGSWDK